MGFFSAILEAIANNYIFFQIITVFLLLSLVGCIVDKKTRKDADVTPIFGNKISLNLKHRDPSAKKDKKSKAKGFTTTVVGGGEEVQEGISAATNQSYGYGNNDVATQQAAYNTYDAYNQNMQQYGQNGYYDANQYQQNAYYNNSYDANSYYNNNGYAMPQEEYNNQAVYDNNAINYNNQMVAPAATTAQISETILPNVATAPAQAQVQGVSAAAPAMKSIVPTVENQVPVPPTQSEFEPSNTTSMDNSDEDSGAMNFNMNE